MGRSSERNGLSYVSFQQAFRDARPVECPSSIYFNRDGSVRRVFIKMARTEDLPTLTIDREQALKLAHAAVQEEYDWWFLLVSECGEIDSMGLFEQEFWVDQKRGRVVVSWIVRFVSDRWGARKLLHTVMVDAATGETRVPNPMGWARTACE